METLKVSKNKISNKNGKSFRIRGTCIGGWMNMESFIDGHPGSEQTLRATFIEILGKRTADVFFDCYLNYFFGEDDIRFIKECGATLIRIPLNYRHFEDDASPFKYKESGFKRLDKILDLCEKYGLYVVLDMHAIQGFQNSHWHSDNSSLHSFFWRDPYYQDRLTALWEEFAKRYKNRTVVAGYDIMNEPCVNTPYGDFPHNFLSNYKPGWETMNRVYRRLVNAIRAIDPEHIIFLEGDAYSSLFEGLEAPFAENLVYSCHNYNAAGFGPGPYPGLINSKSPRHPAQYWDRDRQIELFLKHEGYCYTMKHNIPLWVGEFGAVYNGEPCEIPDRLRAIDDQISVFEKFNIHWTTWTYKDIGVMGMVMLDPESDYMQIMSHMLQRKQELGTEQWMQWMPDTAVKNIIKEAAKKSEEIINDGDILHEANSSCLSNVIQTAYISGLLQPSYVKVFKGMSEQRIDEILKSFAFKNCRVNQGLCSILKRYMEN